MKSRDKFWRVAAILVICAAAVVASCREGESPLRSVAPRFQNVNGPLPSGVTYVVGGGPTNAAPNYGGAPWASTGVAAPPGTVARIHAAGDLSLTRNGSCDPAQQPSYTTPMPLTGEGAGAGRVWVDASTDLSFPPQWQADGAGLVMHIRGDTAVTIMAQRQQFGSTCLVLNSSPPVEVYEFDVSGATTLTIDILGVNVTPSATSVQPGQSINFTAAAINFTAGPTIAWSYDTLTYATQIDVPGCANQPICAYAPSKSGRMQVCMYDEQTSPVCSASSVINVIKCHTGDSLLDNAVLRAGLLQAIKDSWADSVPSSRRREVAGYAYFDSTGLHVARTEDPTKYTPCSVSYGAPSNAVLIFHTHPFFPPEGYTPADTFPTVCNPGKTVMYDVKTWGGPSSEDWASSVSSQHPSYIIDKKRIYVTNPRIIDSTVWADSTKKYDWNTRKCRW
jgi:hypothetical protein